MKYILSGFLCLMTTIYFCFYFNMPGFIVKPGIQEFLNENYSSELTITQIDRYYLPDWFHTIGGYRIEVEDHNGEKISNIYITKRNGSWVLGGFELDNYKKAKN